MFTDMWSLTSIDLENNQLQYLGQLPNLTSLETLNLQKNNIAYLGNNFADLLNPEIFEDL